MGHITVTPAEDDEVIVAGEEVEPERATEPEALPEPESAPEPEREPAPAPKSAPEPAPRSSRRSAYRETTLEDLEPGKMPTAQRIVIIAAIVCIIGALVYYFMAMR